MSDSESFVDWYAVLKVEPSCNPRSLEMAYRDLAKLYHPDHVETADVAKLNEVLSAYRLLRDPIVRAEYDQRHSASTGRSPLEYFTIDYTPPEEKVVLDDADIHEDVLRLLYKKRRENAAEPGVPPFYIQEMINCSDDIFEFHMWYLKERGFVTITEQSTFAITVDGVDNVIAKSRGAKAEKLRIAHSSD